MRCPACGGNDALYLFSSIICTNNHCKNFDKEYAIEKGVGVQGVTTAHPSWDPNVHGYSGINITYTSGATTMWIIGATFMNTYPVTP